MASLIKTNLPNDFLTNLGAYLQTCAYIELELAIVLTKVEPKREPSLTSQSPTNVTRPNKNEQSLPAFRKLAISRLLKRLKDSAKSLPDGLREELLAVCGYIENNKNHRHLATHGAFFLDRTTGLLRVNFFFPSMGTSSLNRNRCKSIRLRSKRPSTYAIRRSDWLLICASALMWNWRERFSQRRVRIIAHRQTTRPTHHPNRRPDFQPTTRIVALSPTLHAPHCV